MKYDVATAVSIGRRDYQEDAVACDFALGAPFGFAVLADGMGGHAAGDIASKIVVTEVFSEIKLQAGDPCALESEIGEVLRSVAHGANACIEAHVAQNPALRGMGATLVAPVLFENRLYWLSIGDSPLFLYRKGTLSQINEDHSLAPQIDMMVRMGQLDAEAARNHPDRNSLTSVVMGRRIPQMDCRAEPTPLERDDIVIASSDGLQYLSNKEIEAVIKRHHRRGAHDIAAALMKAVDDLGNPEQDNVSLALIKIR